MTMQLWQLLYVLNVYDKANCTYSKSLNYKLNYTYSSSYTYSKTEQLYSSERPYR